MQAFTAKLRVLLSGLRLLGLVEILGGLIGWFFIQGFTSFLSLIRVLLLVLFMLAACTLEPLSESLLSAKFKEPSAFPKFAVSNF